MDADALRASLTGGEPPKGLPGPVAAMWRAAKGEWDKAHALVQDDESKAAAWVHAHLHQIEGDEANAGYWYRRAGKAPDTGPLAQEWDSIVAGLLAMEAK